MDTKREERIELAEGGYLDAWRCVCGNTPSLEGFYACNPNTGAQVEPELGGLWDGSSYVCDRCGRIVRQDDGVVIGRREDEWTRIVTRPTPREKHALRAWGRGNQ